MKYFFLLLLVLLTGCDQKPVSAPSKETRLEDNRKGIPGYSWLSTGSNHELQHYRDSFKNYYESGLRNKDFETAATYLMAYGKASRARYRYDSFFYHTGSEFYKSYHDKISAESKSFICYYLGGAAYFNNWVEQSIKWYEEAIAVPTETDLQLQVQGFSRFTLAQSLSNLGQFEKAEQLLVKALDIFEEVGDLKNQGTVRLLLHNNYMQNGAFDEAEEVLKKAMEIIRQHGDHLLIFSGYSMYPHMYMKKEDTLSTIRYIDTLASYEQPSTLDYFKTILRQLQAFKHVVGGEEDSARYYLAKSNELIADLSNPDLKMRVLYVETLFADRFNKELQNPEEVARFYNELAGEEVPNRQHMSQMARALYRYYQAKGDYPKANKYARFLVNDMDMMVFERAKGRLFDLERKYETKKKEHTILQQHQKLEKREKEISLLVAGVFMLVVTSLLFFLWTQNQNVRKEKALARNFALQLLIKTEEERKRIASDLHDSVSNELVNLRHAIEGNNNGLKGRVDTILEEVRTISRNISPVLFDKIGLAASVDQLTDRIQNQHDFFLTADIDYTGSLTTEKELQVYRIIQEAITNTLKHAGAQAAKVTIREDEHRVFVKIKDNGRGFEVDKMLQKGDCFGLLNITERAKSIGGLAQIKSDPAGTSIRITIPK